MTRFSGFLKRFVACALLAVVALVLSMTGEAHAASVSAAHAAPAPFCLTATPPVQQVAVGQTAVVAVRVLCASGPLSSEVIVAWADGTVSLYPLVGPGSILETAHSYTVAGDYHPQFCLVSSSPVGSGCTSVEILVQ